MGTGRRIWAGTGKEAWPADMEVSQPHCCYSRLAQFLPWGCLCNVHNHVIQGGHRKKKSQSGNSQHAGLWCTATHDWLSAHSGVCGRICAQWGVWQEASPACPLHRAEVRNALLGPRFSGKNVALCRCPQRGTMTAQDTVHRDNPSSMILTMGNLEDSLGGPRCWDVLGNP